MLHVLSEFKDYLISEGLVRDPSTTGAKPPVWVSPLGGLNAPNDGQTETEKGPLLIGLYAAPSMPTDRMLGFLVNYAVDIYIRADADSYLDAETLYIELRRRLHDMRHFALGNLLIHESLEIRPLGLVSADEEGGYVLACQFGLMFTEEDRN